MTNRFNRPNTQYFDNSGNVLSGGKLRFKATGSDTLKDTYSDTALSSANTNPVVLDSSGRHGNIFLNGTYRVELLTSSDVQLWQRDPIGDDSTTSPWADWLSDRTYAIDDIVQGSDTNYYRSVTANNVGNNPTSSAANWSKLVLVEEWNTNNGYSTNDIVTSSGKLYRSTANSNSGNPPSGGTNWAVGVQQAVSGTATIAASSGTHAITGVGFKPTTVVINAVAQDGSGSTWTASSTGNSSGTSNSDSNCVWSRVDGANHKAGLKGASIYFLSNNAVSSEASGYISALGTDGFTITKQFYGVAAYISYTCYP